MPSPGTFGSFMDSIGLPTGPTARSNTPQTAHTSSRSPSSVRDEDIDPSLRGGGLAQQSSSQANGTQGPGSEFADDEGHQNPDNTDFHQSAMTGGHNRGRLRESDDEDEASRPPVRRRANPSQTQQFTRAAAVKYSLVAEDAAKLADYAKVLFLFRILQLTQLTRSEACCSLILSKCSLTSRLK
jgi:hypothetical protein